MRGSGTITPLRWAAAWPDALAFFTLHFGMFHFGQAAFLIDFFPLGERGQTGDFEHLMQALLRYWWFVPAAALAERGAFILPPMPPAPPPTSVRGTDIEARKARQSYGAAQMWRPYINVVRMHLLIFFFAFAQFTPGGHPNSSTRGHPKLLHPEQM